MVFDLLGWNKVQSVKLADLHHWTKLAGVSQSFLWNGNKPLMYIWYGNFFEKFPKI
jgi:hypothetical protein